MAGVSPELRHCLAFLLALVALCVGIAAICLGAQQRSCSEPLSSYLLAVGGLLVGFTPALLCAYNCFVTLTSPLDAGDAMGAGHILLFGGLCTCLCGMAAAACLVAVVVLTFWDASSVWGLSGDECSTALTTATRAIVISVCALLGLLAIAPAVCCCCAKISMFDLERRGEDDARNCMQMSPSSDVVVNVELGHQAAEAGKKQFTVGSTPVMYQGDRHTVRRVKANGKLDLASGAGRSFDRFGVDPANVMTYEEWKQQYFENEKAGIRIVFKADGTRFKVQSENLHDGKLDLINVNDDLDVRYGVEQGTVLWEQGSSEFFSSLLRAQQ